MSAKNDDWKINGPMALPAKLPLPTVWPAAMSLGVTFMAFGLVTHWVLSACGGVLFLISAAGWIEDMRND